LGRGWSFKASLSHAQKSHFADFPIFGKKKEEINSANIEFSKASSDKCLLASYRVAKNDNRSTIDIYSRSNLQVTADFSYVCLMNDLSK